MTASESWLIDNAWESDWWGKCENTYAEEQKQITYAYKMGLTSYYGPGKWPCYDMDNFSILDIGGGPTSLMLKCYNRGKSRVVDPCTYPSWTQSRYWENGIELVKGRGEDINLDDQFDEAWLYNVLQHTEDPELIVMKAKSVAKVIRIFEWINIPPCQGHPQELKEDVLNKWLGGVGTSEWVNENGCVGPAYYGVFRY